MKLKILYIESSTDGQNNLLMDIQGRHEVYIVEDLIDLDTVLYDMKGYNAYDVLIVDLALEKTSGVAINELFEVIPELKTMDAFTVVGGGIKLLGFDYVKRVVMKRDDTRKMVEEGRIILLSGHARILKSSQEYTKEMFPTIELIDRSDADYYDALETAFSKIKYSSL